MDYPHIHPDNAPLIWKWITTRQGIALWRSQDLSDPAATCWTPADKPNAPHWKYNGAKPEIVTDPDLLFVMKGSVYKRIKVSLRTSRNFGKITISDASQRKVEKALDAAGTGSWYETGTHPTDPEITVYSPELNPPTLREWITEHALDEVAP